MTMVHNKLHAPFIDGGSGGETHGRLLSIARSVAADYARHPKTAAIIVAGSVSRGVTDSVSDIDTSVYLHEPFTKEEFERELNRAVDSGGALYGGDENNGFALWRCVEGVKYDIGFITLAQTEEILTEVLEKHTLENDCHLIADGILKSIPLYGETIIEGWKKRLADFPDALAKKMVETHIRFTPFWITRDMCAGRNERVWLAELALDHIRNLLWILCGLNRRYYPGKLKGFAQVAVELPVAPANFLHRIEQLLRLQPVEAAAGLQSLVEETYDLIDRHMPEVDSSVPRERFATRQACKSDEQ